MVGNLVRLAVFLFYVLAVVILGLLIVSLVSRGIRFIAGYLGIEVGDFWTWMKGGWKRVFRRRKSRKTIGASRIPAEDIEQLCSFVDTYLIDISNDESKDQDWYDRSKRVRVWLKNIE